MKKIFIMFGKAIVVIWIIALLTMVVAILWGIYINFFARPGIFNNKVYETIDEVHKEYKEARYNAADTSSNLGDIAFTLTVDKNVFVFCDYFYTEGELEDRLFVYSITKTDNGYVLQEPVAGVSSARLPLHNNYQHADYKYLNCMFYYAGEEERRIAFAYKEKDSSDILYYNGIEMKEEHRTNPFTGEEFILCYGAPSKAYTPFERLLIPILVPRHKRDAIKIG